MKTIIFIITLLFAVPVLAESSDERDARLLNEVIAKQAQDLREEHREVEEVRSQVGKLSAQVNEFAKPTLQEEEGRKLDEEVGGIYREELQTPPTPSTKYDSEKIKKMIENM